MHIQTKHRDRVRATIRERVLRFRVEQLKDPPGGGSSFDTLDSRLDRLMDALEKEVLEVLKVPARKKPKR